MTLGAQRMEVVALSDLISWMAPWSGRVLVGAVVLLGMACVWWGMRRRRSASPQCGRCGYSFTGLSSRRCPECGWTARTERETMIGSRRWWLVVIGLVIALSMPTFVVVRRTKQYGWTYYRSFGPGHYFFGTYTIEQITLGKGRVRIVGDYSPTVDDVMLEVRTGRKGERIVIETVSGMLRMRLGTSQIGGGLIGRGDDITGNGRPNIIAELDSRGGDCCLTYYVFELGPDGTLNEIAVLTADYNGGFKDIDGDGIPEFVVVDKTWAYKLTCYACLDYPKMVLTFDGVTWSPDIDRMRISPPTESESAFVERIRSLHADDWYSRRDGVWSEMLRRIYGGHVASAWRLFDAAWEPGWGEKQELLDIFATVLRSSPYYAAVVAVNGGDEARLLPARSWSTDDPDPAEPD